MSTKPCENGHKFQKLVKTWQTSEMGFPFDKTLYHSTEILVCLNCGKKVEP